MSCLSLLEGPVCTKLNVVTTQDIKAHTIHKATGMQEQRRAGATHSGPFVGFTMAPTSGLGAEHDTCIPALGNLLCPETAHSPHGASATPTSCEADAPGGRYTSCAIGHAAWPGFEACTQETAAMQRPRLHAELHARQAQAQMRLSRFGARLGCFMVERERLICDLTGQAARQLVAYQELLVLEVGGAYAHDG